MTSKDRPRVVAFPRSARAPRDPAPPSEAVGPESAAKKDAVATSALLVQAMETLQREIDRLISTLGLSWPNVAERTRIEKDLRELRETLEKTRLRSLKLAETETPEC